MDGGGFLPMLAGVGIEFYMELTFMLLWRGNRNKRRFIWYQAALSPTGAVLLGDWDFFPGWKRKMSPMMGKIIPMTMP